MTPLIAALTIFQLVMLALAILLTLFTASLMIYTVLLKVPWVPTRKCHAKQLLELARLKEGERVLDLGCGDGSILNYAAKNYGARGVGYDLNPMLIGLGKVKGWFNGKRGEVKIHCKDMFTAKWPDVDVVTIYLFPEINAKLEPMLRERYGPETRLVSRAFTFPTLNLLETVEYKKEKFYLYEL